MAVTPCRRWKKRRTRGMAMVEMVFVLPILLLLVFAIAQFGLMFSRWLTLSNAVREGARTGVVFESPCNAGTVDTRVRDTVLLYARNGGIPLQPGDLNPPPTGACGASGAPVTVSASYGFELNIPFANLGTVPLAYSSTMRHE